MASTRGAGRLDEAAFGSEVAAQRGERAVRFERLLERRQHFTVGRGRPQVEAPLGQGRLAFPLSFALSLSLRFHGLAGADQRAASLRRPLLA